MSGNNELSPKLVEILEMSDKLLDAIDSLRCDDNRIPWKIFNELMKFERACIIFNENIQQTEEILG